MKRIIYILTVSLIILGSYNVSFSQTNNALLEVFTGTWCGYCPCGHTIVNTIVTNRPNTLVLEYHGPINNGDPYAVFNGNDIVNIYGITSWPSAVIGRRSGVVGRTLWAGQVYSQGVNYPSPVNLTYNKTYNSSTRQLTLTATATALRDIDTNAKISFVLYENNIVSYQQAYAGCGPGVPTSNYVHHYLVRDMVNGSGGEVFSTGHWAAGTQKTASWNYTLPVTWVDTNVFVGLFAYFNTGSISSLDSYVLQTTKGGVTAPNPTAVNNEAEVVRGFYLSQNYPNPFNPTTNIKFSVPKEGYVSLKFYDILGNEVDSYINDVIKAGIYNATFDGSKLSSGVYYYKLTAGDFTETKRMMLVK